jgi:enamidase
MKFAIANIGKIVSADWQAPKASGDTIVMDEGRILSVGTASSADVSS